MCNIRETRQNCKICGESKPIEDFYRKRVDTLATGERVQRFFKECKTCYGARQRERYSTDEYRERERVRRSNLYKTDEEYKEKRKATSREWSRRNRNAIREKQRYRVIMRIPPGSFSRDQVTGRFLRGTRKPHGFIPLEFVSV